MEKPPLPISRDFLIDIGGWATLKQGQALVDAGRVHGVRYEPPLLSARIESGEEALVTRLKIGSSLAATETLCTCRAAKLYGTICPHVVAAGLEYLRKKAVDSAPAPTLHTKASPPAPIAPTWKRVLVGSGEEAGATPFELTILLPLQFSEAIRKPEMRIILEARTGAGPANHASQPLDAISKTLPTFHAVSEEDEAVLAFFEKTNNGTVPGMSLLPRARWDVFFKTLTGHPRVFLGKKEAVQVRPLPAKPRLAIELLPTGDLELRLQSLPPLPGEKIELPNACWRWQSPLLEEMVFLTPPYSTLLDQPVTIPREGVFNFLGRELPALSRLVEVEQKSALGDFDFSVRPPEIHATLEGSLAGLSLQLEAVYGARRWPLKPKDADAPIPASPAWEPEPGQPLHYWSRDFPAEKAALAEARKGGFAPGDRKPDSFYLPTERAVGTFLANTLPRWRKLWKVHFGPRMESLSERLDYVEPEITFESSGQDWLGLDLHLKPASGAAFSPGEVQRWLQTGQSHQRTAGDRVLLLPTQAWNEMQEALADCDVEQEAGRRRVQSKFAPYLHNVLEAQGWNLSARSTWKPPAAKPQIVLEALPESLRSILRPYQAYGINWLFALTQHGLSGLLADEMGLGKTVQMLGLIQSLLKTKGGQALVVCPTTLIANWRLEAEKFTPGLKVLRIEGADRAERFAAIPQHDLIVTSYALLRRDVARYAPLEFQTVVLDEAQHIKNRASQNAQSAKSLRAQHRFVLTGTPMENSLLDLWSIYDFLLPGYLGTAKDFKDRYETPIAKERDEAAQARLRHRLRPFFLRRTKEEVAADLPAKIEQIAWCDLTDEQREVYQAILDQGRREVFSGSGKSGQGKNKLAILTTLLRLRQVCCHLQLLPGERDRDPAQPWTAPSCKLDHFLELLDEAIDGGHRLLVFSQFVSLLHLIRAALEERDVKYCYLDGSTQDRQAEVDRFQRTPEIPAFLISLKAGGTGLNLTAADTVIHFDPWWNPAVEDQATARAHRIGQKQVVTSYKLIARDTVEEKIVQLQQKKQALIAANIGSDELLVDSLSWEEIQGLFA